MATCMGCGREGQTLTADQRQLVDQHHHLVDRAVAKLPLREQDDARSDAYCGLLRAAQGWDSTVTPFKHWARHNIRKSVRRGVLCRAEHRGREVSLTDLGVYDKPGETGAPKSPYADPPELGFADPADRVALDEMLSHLKPLEREIVEAAYLRGLSVAEASKLVGVAPQRGSEIIRKSLARLRKLAGEE